MARPKTKTAAQANNDYIRANYDRLLLQMPKGSKEALATLAAEQGESISRYILKAVEARSGLKLTLDNALPWIDGKKS